MYISCKFDYRNAYYTSNDPIQDLEPANDFSLSSISTNIFCISGILGIAGFAPILARIHEHIVCNVR